MAANLLNDVALLDELVGLLEVNDRRMPIARVGQEIFHLRNPGNAFFQGVVRRLVKDDPRFVVKDDGFIELLPDRREYRRLDQSEFVVVDLETTGLNPRWDRIIEIAAFKVVPDRRLSGHHLRWVIADEFSALINPQREIPQWITRFTGISNPMVARSPVFGEIADQLIAFIDAATIVAHNVRFDIGFINAEINRIYDKRLFNLRLCTLQLSRQLFPELPNHKLHTVAHYLGVEMEERHRARSDALAATRIFMHMLEQLKQRGLVTLVDVQEFRRQKISARVSDAIPR